MTCPTEDSGAVLQTSSECNGRQLLLLALLALLLVCISTSVNASTGTIRIAAASSLQFALNEIIDNYRASADNKNQNIQAVYGSSGNLYRQIVQGAPFDLFLSADASLVDKLYNDKIATEAGVAFGKGQLVLAVNQHGVDLKAYATASQAIDGLLGQGSSFRLAIANPVHAPYGKAAKEFLESTGQWSKVKAALVYGEKVSQATQYVSSGATTAGVVSLSLAQALDLEHLIIDSRHYQPILHKMVYLADAAGGDFYGYLSTDESVAAVLEKYGYQRVAK